MANNSNASIFNGSSPIPTRFQPFSEEEKWKEAFNVFLAVTEIIIVIIALVCNSIVVYAFITYKKLRNSATNYFVISLAISDILTSALVTTFKADETLKKEWTHGAFMCRFYTTMYLLAVPSSVINLCAVTVDRYLVLRMPLRYNSLMPPRRALFIIGCLWVYAMTWACLPVMGWRWNGSDSPFYDNGVCYFVTTRVYNITVNIVNFILPMLFMAIFWSFIYTIIQQHRKRVLKIERSLSLNTNDSSNSSNNMYVNGETQQMAQLAPKNENNNKRERKRMRRNLRGSRYLGFIVVLFYFCWLPYVTVSMIGNLCVWCVRQNLIPAVLYDALLVLGYMNSALNPFLYPFHDKHFKEAFRDMWRKVKSKTFAKLLSPRKDAV